MIRIFKDMFHYVTSLSVLALLGLCCVSQVSAAENGSDAPVISYVIGSGPYPDRIRVRDMAITISTDIESSCKYSGQDSGQYEYWEHHFTTSDNLTHDNVVKVYSDKNTQVYVKCQSLSTNAVTEQSFVFPIYFGQANVLSMAQNLVADIPMNYDGNFTLSWDAIAGANYYHLMEQRDTEYWSPVPVEDGLLSVSLSRPIEGRYQYKISACTNIEKTNCGPFSFEAIVSVGADVTHFPPEITIESGSGPHPNGVREIDMAISTNLDALCRGKYKDTGPFRYWSHDFDTDDNLNHSGLAPLKSDNYTQKYIRCMALDTGYTHNIGFVFPIYFTDPTILTKPLVFTVDNAANNGNYTLNWDAISGAVSYHIMQSFNGGRWVASESPGSNLSKIFNQSVDGQYSYMLSACTDIENTQCGSFSDVLSVDVTGASDGTADDDGDGVINSEDAFPNDPNEWLDTDGDGTGNNADTDDDNDGVLDTDDAFPLDSTESVDTDNDGIGNNADPDDDNDNVSDQDDAFPLDASEWFDTDIDGIGNNADTDDDNDGVLDEDDAFPLDATESADADNDGIGNNADTDDDNDGVLDVDDAFPFDASESVDTDADGIGNNADTDDDDDGVLDTDDAFPLDATETIDTDSDGVGNNADTDDDNDGVLDTDDAFPLDASEWLDTDLDGVGNNADVDDDNDGVLDIDDAFPLDGTESVDTDTDGVGNNSDTDDDNDGVLDVDDAFPLDATESVDTDADGVGNNADTDDDNDGVVDESDAFPLDPNEWLDTDADGVGNNTDADDDNDGVLDVDDAFPLDATESIDTDADGVGNNSDTDDDNDGVLDADDAFPLDATESVDTDADGIGNNADTDDDNDGVLDQDDVFPLDASESADADNDGIGNNADTDDDNDGVLDVNDAFPFDATESVDTDADGIGNNADTDDDNDGVLDGDDAFPLDATETVDTDADGIGNNADADDDNDGVLDADDAFPLDATESVDTDADGIGNNADTDDDNDGVLDGDDAFPLDATESIDTDADGIGNNADTDDDNDGVLDADDAFPLDDTESVDTDADGIGNNADTDDDNDGVLDADDAFPLDDTESVDTDGDGIGNNADTDDDNDGVLDADDAFPLDASESVDTDADGIGNNADTDDDNDGVLDADDAFPLDDTESVDTDADGIGNNADADDDNDGILDGDDAFPLDASESVDTDADGIGNNADTDDDNDGVLDVDDAFPLDDTESVDTDADGIGNNADTDDDNDGILDGDDAFPLDASESIDTDADGIGNNSDTDDDNDGVLDADDAFPLDATESVDTDADGVGNNADTDDDNDGVLDADDAFPLDDTETVDTDADGIGNNADTDDDNDGVLDADDAFPLDDTESVDTDADGIGNNADADDDNDGILDGDDAFPLDASESVDTDGDGVGNNSDDDDDNDGVLDADDAFPLDDTETIDTDADGVGNNADTDDDNDGILDGDDAFPLDASESIDTDADGIGNNSDTDDDNDGVLDADDAFPLDATESVDTDADGVGNNADTDDDNDGVLDADDAFPLDASESLDTDADGIGNNSDDDDDNDGVLDVDDAFPLDATESLDTDADGIGNNSDDDDDNDGVLDTDDAFPLDASETVDTDADGIGNNADTDDDNDGVLDVDDAFPLDATESADLDGDGIGDNSDPDRDGDNVDNALDFYPNDATRSDLEQASNLSIELVDESVQISWELVGADTIVAGYHVERAIWGGTFERIATLNSTESETTDNAVSNKSAYQYRILSYTADDRESAASVPVEIFIAYNNDIINNLEVQLVNLQPVLTWSSTDADEFVVFRGQQGTALTPIAVITEDSFTDINTVESNSYQYQVRNRKNFVNSINSDSFDIDGPLSVLVEYYQAQSLSIEISNASLISTGNYELIQASGVETSLSISHINAEGVINISLTDGTTLIEESGIEGIFTTNIPAAGAVWTITSSVNDGSIIQNATATLTTIVDSIAPELTVNGASELDSNEATIVLSGTATDDNELASVTVSSSLIANQEFQALLTEQDFSVEIPLSVGENVLTVTASDAAGNSTEASVTVTKQDELKPVIELTSHSDNQTVTSDQITIAGRVQSGLPVQDIGIRLGELAGSLSVNTDGSYGFEFAQVQLSEGLNTISIVATSVAGDTEEVINITYEEEQSTDPAQLEILAPLPGSSVQQSDFVIQGQIVLSQLTSLTANGLAVHLISTGTNTQAFNFPISFAVDTSAISVNFIGTQGSEEVINLSVDYFLDNASPIIQLTSGLQPSPTLNETEQNPFEIQGTVTDDNLSAVFINDNQVTLTPGATENEYEFSVNLQLETGVESEVEIKAQDFSGNTAIESYVLVSNATTNIDIIGPSGNKEFLITETDFSLQVLVRVEGIQETETVQAYVDSGTKTPLAITETLASGDLLFTASSGEHILTVEVLSADSDVVSSSQRKFSLIDPADIPLEMARTEPVNGEQHAEANGYIAVFFSKPIEPDLLTIEVFETVSGKTYIKEDERELDFLNVKGYQLQDVNRSNELVPGGVSQLPGDNIFAFYPERDIGYNANVFVKVTYDGEEFHRFSYKVRKLPTFVTGALYDQLRQPIVGVMVEHQGRKSFTNSDGVFQFGQAEPGNDGLASGVHKLVVNAGFANPKFGMVERYINVEQGRSNALGIVKVPVLDTQTPFVPLQTGQNVMLAKGELNLDLTNASLVFPDGKSSGMIHLSFLELSDIDGSITPAAMPSWLYSIQPIGIRVAGEPKITIRMPKLYNGHNYVPDNGTLLVLVGRKPNSSAIVPVGVGEVNGIHLESVGELRLEQLDNIGYAFVSSDKQDRLREYADGEIDLRTLIAYLE